MPNNITRRKALTAGAVSAGMLMGTACSNQEQYGTQKQEEIPFSQRTWWPPGPNKNLVRDLTPGPTPVRLACMSSKTMLLYPQNMSITEAVKRIRDQGYTAANCHYGIGTRNKWLDASESEIAELKEALKKYDVEFFDTMVWTNLLHPDEKTRQINLKYVAENIIAADRCGCRSVTMVTGSCDPEYYIGMHPDNWTRETWNVTLDSVRQLIRDTSGCKTVLGMESILTTNLDCPQAHKQLMENVGDPRCKTVFDLANMTSFERYYHSTETINETFDLLGEDIMNCHGKDNIILRDRMLCHIVQVPPGEGVHDYEMYLVRMSRMKWPRTLMLEHLSDEQYPAVKEFIEKTAEKVGVKIYS